MALLTSREEIKRVLVESKTIAVLGANPKRGRPAHFVPEYLKEQGYRIIPVNPVHEGETLFGETIRARLQDIEEEIDIVNVFRRSEQVPQHLDDILAAKPKVVWMQSGIRHDGVAQALSEAGIDVVQSRCMLVDHRGL